jgi:hypothetical protein
MVSLPVIWALFNLVGSLETEWQRFVITVIETGAGEMHSFAY